MDVQVDSADVVRLVLQFLKLHGLVSSFEALKTETGVSLNVVHDKAAVLQHLSQGQWDLVLQDISVVDWSPADLAPLFEWMLLDLVQRGEWEAGRVVLRESAPLRQLRDNQPDQYHRLEHALVSRYLTPEDAAGMERLRDRVVQFFDSNLVEAPKEARLLRVINDSLKWHLHGACLPADCRFDLFRGVMVADSDKTQHVPRTVFTHYPLKVASFCLHPAGSLLCVGDEDGFVTLLDFITGQPHPDYEAADPMAVPAAATCCQFNANGTHLAVGTVDGSVAVWRVEHGTTKPVKYFSTLCRQPINSVAFAADGNVVACSDHSLYVLGLRSGSVLRHIAGIHCARIAPNGHIVGLSSRSIVTLNADFAQAHCPLSSKPCILNATGPMIIVDGGLFEDPLYTLLCEGTVLAAACNQSFAFLVLGDGIKVFDRQGAFKETIAVSGVIHIAAHPKLNVVVVSDGLTLTVLKA